MERVRTNISMPKGLPQRAHAVGVNISAIATKAVLREVKIVEKETPASSRQTRAGAAATCEGRAS